jgi:hypothetical protein
MKRIPEASCGTGKMAVTQGKSLDSVGCHDGGEVPCPRPQKLALFLSGNKSRKRHLHRLPFMRNFQNR